MRFDIVNMVIGACLLAVVATAVTAIFDHDKPIEIKPLPVMENRDHD